MVVSLGGRQDEAVGGLAVLAVVVERLEDELGRRRRGEVEADHLQVGQGAQGREQRHRLALKRKERRLQ